MDGFQIDKFKLLVFHLCFFFLHVSFALPVTVYIAARETIKPVNFFEIHSYTLLHIDFHLPLFSHLPFKKLFCPICMF